MADEYGLETTQCPNCGGSGEVPYNNDTFAYCRRCGGAGVLWKAVQINPVNPVVELIKEVQHRKRRKS